MIRPSAERSFAGLWLTWLIACMLAAGEVRADQGAAGAPWVHAFAAYGDPRYTPDFTHFDFVDPDAPKGGTLYLPNPDRRQNFDKYNTYTVRGNAPVGVGIFMAETLTTLGADEPRTMYGLLAEGIRVEPDFSAISFRLHPKARFTNGDPVTADDVKHSFEMLIGKHASPTYATALAGVAKAVIVDERTIRFELAERNRDTLFKIGALPVFSRKWGQKPDGTRKPFDEIVDERPIMTGPYTIAAADSGRRLEFKRDPNYWARDLPVRRGFYNFDRIVYRYYQDEAVALEAFKAGEFDIVRVYGARTWMRQHKGPKWDDGRIVKREVKIGTGQGLQTYTLNMRRTIFQDARVRQALALAYDFDTNNRYKLYRRANSLFNNSELAAQGLPSQGELALLEPYRQELPPEVFGPPYVAASTGGDAQALRRHLLQARALLEAAGWKLGDDGKLRTAQGEAFEFEYLAPGDSVNDARLAAWARNLAKLGISFKVRNVDFALFSRRLEEYDFDVITIAGQSFGLPSAADMASLLSSKSADEKGNNNFRGVKSPVVDRLLDAMNKASTPQEFRDAASALDRVVMWNHWQVPELYGDLELLSHWDKFGIPKVWPKYFTTDLGPDVDEQLAWPITTWWIKGPAKR